MKVVLSLAPCFFPSGSKWTLPLSILYPAAALEEAGVPVEVVDPFAERLSFAAYIRRILAAKPDVLGLSVTSDAYFSSVKVCAAIKRLRPELIIIMGGPHPTLLGGSILEALPQVDILVKGEGELALRLIVERLAQGRDLEGVPNTIWRRGGAIVENPEKSLITELDSIPFPAFHLVDYAKYDLNYDFHDRGPVRSVNIISSRGCPFNCAFCSNSNIWGNKVRFRSLENVLAEMKLRIEQLGVNFFQFQDDAFNLSPQRLHQFCDLVEAEGLDIGFACALRADQADMELLGRLKSAGLTHAYFSVEHINDHIRQDCLGKSLPRAKIDQAIQTFEELGIGYSVAFMVSLPDEGPAELEENLRFMASLRPGHPETEINFNLTRIYPGTRLETEAWQRGVLRPGFTWLDQRAMRRYSPGVFSGLMGEVPIYKEKLSYLEMFSSLFEWRKLPIHSSDPQKVDQLLAYGVQFLASIKHPKDVLILLWLVAAWLKAAWQGLWGSPSGRKTD